MEYCSQGDLLTYLHTRLQLIESEAFVLFRQLIEAIETAHNQGYVHRDIKLENLLLCEDGTLKIADWGLACKWTKDSKLQGSLFHYFSFDTPDLQFIQTDFPGSIYYASPEVILREPYLGPEIDVWSIGVTLFALVGGCLPFCGEEQKEIMRYIISAPIKLHPAFSYQLKDLLRRLLDRDSNTRLTIEQIKSHPWYQGFQNSLAGDEALLETIQQQTTPGIPASTPTPTPAPVPAPTSTSTPVVVKHPRSKRLSNTRRGMTRRLWKLFSLFRSS